MASNAPPKTMLADYHTLWADHLVPLADQTQNGLTWGKDFESGKVGILPGDYGIAATFKTPAQRAEFADVPLPYDVVALRALARGSVEYTMAYNAVFNQPGSPWFKMFEEAVYSGNPGGAIQQGQSGIQSTLPSVKS